MQHVTASPFMPHFISAGTPCYDPCMGARPMHGCARRGTPTNKNTKKQVGHHARPRWALATAPLRTGAVTCKTGSCAGQRAGAKSDPVRRRSNHAWTEHQAGKRKRANSDAVRGWRVHTADDTPSRNAATRSKHCNFTAKGTYGPGQLQGRAGTGQHKPWQQQREHDWSETSPATPPPRGPTQNTPGRGHPGQG